MISTSFLTIAPVAIAAFMLGIVTLASNSRQYANRIFAALSALSGVYVVVNFMVEHNHVNALFWVRGTFLLATGMLLGLVIFLNNFPRRTLSRTWELIMVLISAGVAVITLAPAFVPGILIVADRVKVLHGPLYPIFLLYLAAFLTLAIIISVKAFRASHRVEKARLRFVVYGSFITSGCLVLTNVLLPIIQGHDAFAVFGSYLILIFIGCSTYAIIHHRLFNIRFLVARAVAYFLLLVALAGIYIGGAFAFSITLFSGHSTDTLGSLANAFLAIILAFTFQPLRRFFERVTNRIFYRDSYDSQKVINDFSKILVSELELELMLKQSLTQICRSMHVQFGQLVVFDNDRLYRIEHYGPLPKRLMVAPQLRKLNKPILVADELEGGEHKTLMDGHGIRVSVELYARSELTGYLLLGDKLSGDIYSNQDIKLLEIIKKELAVAILNAKAYAEIQEFNQTLQQRIDHATNRLRVANRHLKELDKTKDEFISMASHQLRTPLTTIKGYLSMMLEGDAGHLTVSQKEFVGYAFGASERMVNLISDLLNVSRLSAGRFLIQAKPTDMVQIVADEVRQLRGHATAKNIQLIFDHPGPSFPLVELDDNKTRQVIMNFIDNGIYYTEKGSVTVSLEHDGDMVRLQVQDTGIGVPEKAKRSLFSKFYRAENAQELRPDGTGLGLYLAKRVIEDQGGTIIFKSTEGHGSVFGFELPVKAHKPPMKARVTHG